MRQSQMKLNPITTENNLAAHSSQLIHYDISTLCKLRIRQPEMELVRAGHFSTPARTKTGQVSMTRMDVLQMSSSGCLGSLAIVLTDWGRSLKRLATVSVGCSQY